MLPVAPLRQAPDDDGCSGTGQTCSATVWDSQRRTHTLSNGEVIWDLAGNVWEWVDYNNASDKPYVSSDSNPVAAWRELSAVNAGLTTMALTELRPTAASHPTLWDNGWNSAQGIGQYYAGSNGSGGALLRGADWDNDTGSGVFAADLNVASTNSDTDIGLRCAFRLLSP